MSEELGADAAARYDSFLSRRFHMAVLQPTTLCPWDCDYCYLADREQRREMSPHVAEAVAASIRAQGSRWPVRVVWHGGEPLSLPLSGFERLLSPFETLRSEGRVQHCVQTNAGLITPEWCALFERFGFSVGVSVDGPEWANAGRHDRSGRSVHDRIMRGVRTLRECGVPFTTIAVVTPETVGRPHELAAFFEELGTVRVGFNIEEREGANTGRPVVDEEAAVAFWRALIERRSAGSPLRVREVERLLSSLRAARDHREEPASPLCDPVPTVAWNGETVLLSPEFSGTRAPEYDDFVLGNVLTEPLTAMVARAHEAAYVDEFARSLRSCAHTCEFYAACRGGQTSNRYSEHGTLLATETAFCRATRQAPVRALHQFAAATTERT
ncbi:cyclophane-forming radical SAM peptide maturase AmcB [Streptomyces xiaopingdaonensis]|uniref:cyclophane-forming radical SAM peptide maturase AmcB n=1 Tax=Streptomyces xiaopingdaonensis TaxID=1565415 RepID=UPI0002D9DEE0|nr:cyclophane-forming radical SAM peptide maturase AmcB [Streptomyces xiaopingdaonensis]